MPINTTVGSFTIPAASSASITLDIGPTDKAIHLWWCGRSDSGDGVGRGRAIFGHGFAISASSRACVSATIDDASAAASSASYASDAACVIALDAAGSVAGALDVQSFGNGKLIFDVDTQFTAALTVQYQIFGGQDLRTAYIGTMTEPASGSDQVITGPSDFVNTLLVISASQTSAPPGGSADARISFGAVADNAGLVMNAVHGIVSDHASDPMTAKSYCRAGVGADCFLGFGTTGNIASRGRVVRFRSSGAMVVNFTTSASACRYFYLALSGGQSYIREFATTTSTSGTIALDTPVPFTPRGGYFVSAAQTAESTSATLQAGGNLSFGASDGTNDRALAVRDNDAVNASEVTTAIRTSDVFCFPAATSGALDAAMTLNQYPANNVELQMTDADSAGHYGWSLLFGSNTGRLTAVGSLTVAASATNGTTISVTGLAFQPRTLLTAWCGRGDATDAIGRASARFGNGMASPTEQQCIGGRTVDAAAAADTGFGLSTAAVVVTTNTSDAIDGLVALQSFNWDGFTLVVNDQLPADLTVAWRVDGGTDLTYAKCGSFLEPTTTGTDQSVTDPDSQCNVLVAINQSFASGTASQTTYRNNFGVCAKEPSGSFASAQLVVGSNDTSDPTLSQSYCRKAECFAGILSSFNNIVSRGTVTAFNSDGSFTVNFSETYNTSANRRFYWMVMGGGQNAIRKFTTLTNTSSTIAMDSGVTFVPTGAMFASHCTTESASDTFQTGVNWSVGFTDGTNHRCVGFRDNHNVGTTEVTTVFRDSDVYAQCDATAGTLAGAMTFNSFLSTGQIECQMSDADPSGAFGWVWVTGPNAPTGVAGAAVQPYAADAAGSAGSGGTTGTATAATSSYAADSAAAEAIPSTASAAASAFAVDSAGAETNPSTATAATVPFAATAAAAESFTGSAAAAAQPFAVTAAASEVFESVAAAALPPPGVTAAALESIPGTCAAAVSPFTVTGGGSSGNNDVSGSAEASVASFGLVAAGTEGFLGTVTAALQPFACAAAAALVFVGSAAAECSPFGAIAAGLESIGSTGSAAASPFACTAAALAIQDVTGTATAAVSRFACVGAGTATVPFIELRPGYAWIVPPLDTLDII